MFPDNFDYHRATTVSEALDLLATHEDSDVAVLAGGHSLVPAMKNDGRTPDVVVDLEIDALEGVHVLPGRIVVGALSTYAALANDEQLQQYAPVLAAAVGEVGDRQIRNRGTLGGNVAEAHPAADPPAAILAADATVLLRNSDGKREVAATDFFRGDGETAVERGELVSGVRIPDQRDVGTAYVRKTHPATGYAMVGVAAVVDVADSVVTEARVAVTGIVDRTVRLPAAEDALTGSAADLGTVERAVGEADASLDGDALRSDPHASGRFRAHLLESHVEEAVTAAIERASDPDTDANGSTTDPTR